jgi:hypothetical protein
MRPLLSVTFLFFVISCAEPQPSQPLDLAQLKTEIIQASIAFQTAYVNNDYQKAKAYISKNMPSTIFNSNGTPLVVQTEEQITNSGLGWSFAKFDMSNHQVFIAPDTKSIAIVFETEGVVRFDESGEEVPYSTRASQFWVATNMGWKILQSHWSPKAAAKGIPVEN